MALVRDLPDTDAAHPEVAPFFAQLDEGTLEWRKDARTISREAYDGGRRCCFG
jgi:hypothetical protein